MQTHISLLLINHSRFMQYIDFSSTNMLRASICVSSQLPPPLLLLPPPLPSARIFYSSFAIRALPPQPQPSESRTRAATALNSDQSAVETSNGTLTHSACADQPIRNKPQQII
jgi:hypothetical protein